MKNKITARQMINVELAIRASNKVAVKKLKHYVPKAEQKELKIAFNCECSDPSCKERILLTLKEYEKLHNNFARFVIKKGHNQPLVEKVKGSAGSVSLVEKYSLK